MGVHHGPGPAHPSRRRAPITRPSLRAAPGCPRTTLTHVTAQLLADGSVAEVEPAASSGGWGPAGTGDPAPAERSSRCRRAYRCRLVQLTVTDLLGSAKAAACSNCACRDTSRRPWPRGSRDEIEKLKLLARTDHLLRRRSRSAGPVDAGQRTILASINTGWRNLPLAGMLERRTA